MSVVRKPLLAFAALALLTETATAQLPMPGVSFHGDKPAPTPEQIEKQKALDRAYKSATQKIPEQAKTNDPWSDVREIPAPTKKKRR
jgi:hypothetical protein